MKNIIILTLVLFCSCGKLKMKLEDKPRNINQSPDIDTEIVNSRLINEENNEVPIELYSDHSIIGSGIYHQATLIHPEMNDGNHLKMQGFTHKDNLVYISYSSQNSQYSVIDVLNISDPRNVQLVYSYVNSDYSFGMLKYYNNHLYVVATGHELNNDKILVLNDNLENAQIINEINLNNEKFVDMDLLYNELTIATDSSIRRYDLNDVENFILLEHNINSEVAKLRVSLLYTYLISTLEQYIVIDPLEATPYSHQFDSNISQASTIKQNALMYINTGNNSKLSVVDNSSVVKQNPQEMLHDVLLEGESSDISLDQQKLYLAQGLEGFVIANADVPHLTESKGKLLFENDSVQSADKVNLIAKSEYKILFLNDNNNGLRILTENYNKQASDVVLFYAKGLENQTDTKLIVRINGQVIDKVVIHNDEYQMYGVTHSQNITESDNVEVILHPGSNGENHKAFVSFVKVNGMYCYQQSEVNSDDIGLLQHLQTISVNQTICQSYQTLAMCTSGMDKFPLESCSLPNNLIGKLVCDETGLDYSCEDSGSCEDGFSYVAGNCVAQICTPNSVQACTIVNGAGSQTCDIDGLSFGACSLTSCDMGYHASNNLCEENIIACSETNGSGTQTWNGSSYGACQLNSCNNGYYLNENSCLFQSCTPNASESCNIENGTGSHVCDSVGSSFGSCNLSSCNSGYHANGNICESDTLLCAENNGTGTQTWNGSSFGSCQLNSCNDGYYLSGNSCLAQSCSPNTAQSCSISNGTGTQTCNIQGSAYSSCELASCDSGYHANGNICEADIVACSVDNGTGTQAWNGSNYGSCEISSCNAGYYNNGVSCIAQICTPNATLSCSISNGSGTQLCNAQGSALGACELNSCDNGYYENGGSCVAQVCSPSSTQSCTITNGSGSQVCNIQGSAYSSCEPTSCNGGYHSSGSSCDANVISCPIENGTGTQTWNGSSYGTCTVTSCSSDAYQSGNSCVLYCPDPLLIHVVILGAHVCL